MKPLRIFYAVSQTPNPHALPGSNLWHLNLYPPLIELGHEVVIFNYDFTEHLNHIDTNDPENVRFIAKHRPILEQRLLDQVRAAHKQKPFDLFFSYFYSACVTPAVIAEIRQLGILTVNFYCNAAHQFQWIAEIAPAFDFCMVPEEQALPKYTAVGAHPVPIQMAANPAVYKPHAVPVQYPVTFVGQKYLNRPEYMGYLHQHGVDVRAWGPGWQDPDQPPLKTRAWRFARRIKRHVVNGEALPRTPSQLPLRRCGPPLSDDELITMYSRSAISLNFSEVSDQVSGAIKRHLRLRDFEAPMSGAFYFTGYQEEIRQYYEVDRELICYDSKEELLDKVRYYLRHEQEAKLIRAAGLRRAQRDHTWKKRFEQLFAHIGLP